MIEPAIETSPLELLTLEEVAAKLKMEPGYFRRRLDTLIGKHGFPAPHPATQGHKKNRKWFAPAVNVWLAQGHEHLLPSPADPWDRILNDNAAREGNPQ